jgi:alkylation response protein AidB-like acyl-CoA dehydrogenase
MDIGFTETQEMLRTTARAFLADKCPESLVRAMEEDEVGYVPEIWKEMADLGWMGLMLPEEYGGAGGNFLDLVVLLEEMGRACLPGPFLSTVVLGALPLLRAGSEAQKRGFLPKVSQGEMILTLALTESDGQYNADSIRVDAVDEGGHFVLSGTKLFVPDAHVASYMLCVARTGGISLFLVDASSAGIGLTLLKTVAGDKQCEVVFNGVKVSKNDLLGQLDEGWGIIEDLLREAAVAKCAEMVGGAQQVLEMSVSYAKERVQFGKPIGSFQSIQNYCADMLIDISAARDLTYQSAWMISEGLACAREVAIAKVWVSRAYGRVAALGHQIHGAIGFTWDHDMQLYSRRAAAAGLIYGTPNHHLMVIAKGLGILP